MTTNPTDDRIETIALDLIDPDPENRPAVLDDAFVASVAQHGVLMPILVTPTYDGRFRLVAGERRYRAALAAGQPAIPASVRAAGDATAAVWQAVENLARVDLIPSQQARQVARIMAAGMKQKALAAAVNRPLSWVRARLALVGLPAAVQDAIDAGTYDPSDALVFGKYADRPEVIDAVLADNYRSRSDLDWRLTRAAIRIDADREYAAVLEACHNAGWRTYEGHQPQDTHRGAKRLTDLGIDDHDAHSTEPCHLVVLHRSTPTPEVTQWCTEPKRHATKGTSPVKTTTTAPSSVDDDDAAARETARATRAANAHRAAFAREAIASKLRSRDVLDFVLPVLFDTAGQTELKAAARLLGVEARETDQSNWKDYVTPLQQWAGESTANLTRAMLAVTYVLATDSATMGSDHWRRASKDAVAAWLDGLGYQPDT